MASIATMQSHLTSTMVTRPSGDMPRIELPRVTSSNLAMSVGLEIWSSGAPASEHVDARHAAARRLIVWDTTAYRFGLAFPQPNHNVPASAAQGPRNCSISLIGTRSDCDRLAAPRGGGASGQPSSHRQQRATWTRANFADAAQRTVLSGSTDCADCEIRENRAFTQLICANSRSCQ